MSVGYDSHKGKCFNGEIDEGTKIQNWHNPKTEPPMV